MNVYRTLDCAYKLACDSASEMSENAIVQIATLHTSKLIFLTLDGTRVKRLRVCCTAVLERRNGRHNHVARSYCGRCLFVSTLLSPHSCKPDSCSILHQYRLFVLYGGGDDKFCTVHVQ